MNTYALKYGKALMLLMLLASVSASANDDVWTQYARATGAFSPHVDNCGSGEAFVAIGGGDLGFCIEEDRRSAANWEDAKQDCASDGKRLPEPAEFVYACVRAGALGLNDMGTTPNEWGSNFPTVLYDVGANFAGVVTTVMGAAGCRNATVDGIATSNQTTSQSTYPYRCVR